MDSLKNIERNKREETTDTRNEIKSPDWEIVGEIRHKNHFSMYKQNPFANIVKEKKIKLQESWVYAWIVYNVSI